MVATTLWIGPMLASVVLPFESASAFVIRNSPLTPLPISSTWNAWGLSPRQAQRPGRRKISPLQTAAQDDDPFRVLGLDEPTADLKVIKRAYKRMALKYHPDMTTTKDSSPEEKKAASDRFAKINWAYDILSGKSSDNGAPYGKTSTSSSSSGGWTPPHRRSGSYTTSTPGGSSSRSDYDAGVDWTDFMPKDYSEQYDAGGDSFGKIFSDMLVGAAAGAAGMGSGNSIFKDFIEFLEGNVGGMGGPEDDLELRVLLQTGTLEEVAEEMDDTDLVVTQLKSKLSGIQDEILTKTAEASQPSTRYMEKIELEESLAELKARKDVVEGYVKKSQKRLLLLQTRYKELITGGQNDSYAGGQSTQSSWDDIRREASGSSGDNRSRERSDTTSSSRSYSQTTDSASTSTGRTPKRDEDAWMNESFGSSNRRGRGGSRRRSARRSRPTSESRQSQSASYTSPNPTPRTPPPSPAPAFPRSPPPSTSQRTTRVSQNSNLQSTSSSREPYVPPHRRTSKSYESRQEEDNRRMRELKVDEEFDKLKRDLGL